MIHHANGNARPGIAHTVCTAADLEAGGQGSVSICIHQGQLCAMKQIPSKRKVVAQTEDRAVSAFQVYPQDGPAPYMIHYVLLIHFKTHLRGAALDLA